MSQLEYNRDLTQGVDFGGRRAAVWLPAVHRYDGRFFQALGADGRKKLTQPGRHVLFLSGLYGLLRPTEPIQLYSCPLSVQVVELWNSDSLLTDLLCEYMERYKIVKIFDLTAVDAYRRLIDWRRVVDTGAEVLHCFDAMAAGDFALISFGQVLASNLIDLSDGELIDMQPETRTGRVRFRSLPQPPSGGPVEVAGILFARNEADILQPLPSESLGEYIRGGNPAPSRNDGGAGRGGEYERDWRFTATTKFIKDVKQRLDLFEQVLKAVEEIRQRPASPRGNTVKRLTRDLKGMWRYRIGDFRLVYEPDDDRRVVRLLSISHRKDVYE